MNNTHSRMQVGVRRGGSSIGRLSRAHMAHRVGFPGEISKRMTLYS